MIDAGFRQLVDSDNLAHPHPVELTGVVLATSNRLD
jgi:hypothetical protein